MNPDGRIVRGLLAAVLVGTLVATTGLTAVAGEVGPSESAAAMQDDDLIAFEVTDRYDGLAGESQTVGVVLTMRAKQPIDGLEIVVGWTNQSFVDYQSFEVSTADVEYENPRNGMYRIPAFEEGGEVTISFDAYPRRLDEPELVVARVGLNAENPQTYARTLPVTADLSNSPVMEYRALKTKQDMMLAFAIGGGILGVIGILSLLVCGVVVETFPG